MAQDPCCVWEGKGDFEVDQVRAFLRVHDIPCELRGEAVGPAYGFTLGGLGMVQVVVKPDLVEHARELLARVESGELTLPEPEAGLLPES